MNALIAAVVNAIIGPIADKVLEGYKDHNRTTISKQQIEADLRKVAINAATDAYKSGSDAAWRIYDSFQQSLRASEEIRRVWRVAVYSQLFFVVFLEFGVPALVHLGVVTSWRVGSLDTWAMGFLAASLGISPIVLRPPKPPSV